MEHTHRISPVDVHSGPGPHNGFRSYQSYTRYDFGGLQKLIDVSDCDFDYVLRDVFFWPEGIILQAQRKKTYFWNNDNCCDFIVKGFQFHPHLVEVLRQLPSRCQAKGGSRQTRPLPQWASINRISFDGFIQLHVLFIQIHSNIFFWCIASYPIGICCLVLGV